MRLFWFLLVFLALAGCSLSGVPVDARSGNAFLSGLVMSDGDLDRPFARDVRSYVSRVPFEVSSVQFTLVPEDDRAKILLDGQIVPNSLASAPVPLAVGDNMLTFKVLAEDEVTQLSYSVFILRDASENAFLSNLTLSTGQTNEQFLPTLYDYSANVADTVETIQLTATAQDSTSTISINGRTFASGEPSQAIPLFLGSNVIGIRVTAQDGRSKRNYILAVERGTAPQWQGQLSNVASLANLSLSTGTLDPLFNTQQREYTQTVDNGVYQVQLLPVATDLRSSITVNGEAVTSGTLSPYIGLGLGKNIINVAVKSQDGLNQKTYTINVVRLPKSNASLASVSLSEGTLQPFSAGVSELTASVGNAISSISVAPQPQDVVATMKVNTLPVLYGQSSDPLLLAEGANVIPIQVTAEDGVTQRDYTLTVTRQGSATVSLSGLTVSSGVLSPAFSSGTKLYAVNVDNSVSSITLTPALTDATNSMTINGDVASGGAGYVLPLTVGQNDALIKLVSSDGKSSSVYKVVITRSGLATSDLASLAVLAGGVQAKALLAGTLDYTVNLLSDFSAGTTVYNLRVANDTGSIQIVPVAQTAGATITVDGSPVISGQNSQSIALAAGATKAINVVVTSSDSLSNKNYLITVYREGAGNADLASLTVAGLNYSPNFNAALTEYSVDVPWNTTSVAITPVLADTTASVKIKNVITPSGSPYSVTVQSGSNVIPIEVTAQNYSTKRLYNLTVNVDSGQTANLSRLSLSSGVLSPAFNPAVTSYDLRVSNQVSSLTLVPEVSMVGSTVQVNGAVVNSGSPSASIALSGATSVITVNVTSADGSSMTSYNITVIPTDATLDGISLSTGTLSPGFSPNTVSYSVALANTVSSIAVTPITYVEGVVTQITANGATVASGANIPLNVGPNNVTILVTAADGVTQRSYSVVVNRAASASTSLQTLLPPKNTGSLLPAFAADVFSYMVVVPNSVISFMLTPYAVDTTSTIKVNGLYVASGTPSPATALKVGDNIFTVTVTAENGATSVSYTVTVVRQADFGKVYLLSLTPSAGSLSPTFDSAVTSYTSTVSNSVSTYRVTPVVNSTSATITVNGWRTASGSSSADIPLNVGENTISTVVSLTDGSFKTYNIFVTRSALVKGSVSRASADASLVALMPLQGKLDSAFTASQTAYHMTVPYLASAVRISATTNDAKAALKINGNAVPSGQPSGYLALQEGNNQLQLEVTAADGVTRQLYTVDVVRQTRTDFVAHLSHYLKASNTDVGDEFGHALAMDGQTLVIGARHEDGDSLADGVPSGHDNNNAVNAGGVYVFEQDALARWTQVVYLKPTDIGAEDLFGSAVAIDRGVLAIGAAGADAVYVYRRVASQWQQEFKLTGVTNSGFGGALDVRDNTLMVGSAAKQAGAVDIFVRDAQGRWQSQAHLTAANAVAGAQFGAAVVLGEDIAVVGAPLDDGKAGIDSGAVYLFARSSGVWSQQSVLAGPRAGDQFGGSVALDADSLVIGAVGEDSSVADSGAVYVMQRVNGAWREQAKLKAGKPVSQEKFGTAVAIQGDTVVIGASGAGSGAGAGYVFMRRDGLWQQQLQLKATNAGAGDGLGHSLALDNGQLLLGTPLEDGDAVGIDGADSNLLKDSGAVYIYR
ncbi:MAG: cadherin-like beta sandwich domain-containing protein [Gammaproteobacteria bacterium]|nr:cadherin-like beta sandwich domain-containing protein [Gammaproteobacteria bacterium]